MALPKKRDLGAKLRPPPAAPEQDEPRERHRPDMRAGFRTRAIEMRDTHVRPAKQLLVGRDTTFVALFEVFWQAFWDSPEFRRWMIEQAGLVHDGRQAGQDVRITLPEWMPKD